MLHLNIITGSYAKVKCQKTRRLVSVAQCKQCPFHSQVRNTVKRQASEILCRFDEGDPTSTFRVGETRYCIAFGEDRAFTVEVIDVEWHKSQRSSHITLRGYCPHEDHEVTFRMWEGTAKHRFPLELAKSKELYQHYCHRCLRTFTSFKPTVKYCKLCNSTRWAIPKKKQPPKKKKQKPAWMKRCVATTPAAATPSGAVPVVPGLSPETD